MQGLSQVGGLRVGLEGQGGVCGWGEGSWVGVGVGDQENDDTYVTP